MEEETDRRRQAAVLQLRADEIATAAARLRRLAEQIEEPLQPAAARHDGHAWRGTAADQARSALDARLEVMRETGQRLRERAAEADARATQLRDDAAALVG